MRPPPTHPASRPRSRPRSGPASPRELLAGHLRQRGLKRSHQRDAVLDVFLATTGHVSLDELTGLVRGRHPEIGYTTVYRTMKLLAECGVASVRHFGDGQARYELDRPGGHHDHLVCESCGRIEEFEDDQIEELQRSAARRHGFVLEGHTLELHGRCARCRASRAGGRSHS
jgi:Fur family transcriptional regulator, ferric uptake regulator